MPRRLDSLNQGGYDEPIDVGDRQLDAVVGMLDLADAEKRDAARRRIFTALVDLQTARVRTARAKTIREDLRDLDRLAESLDPDRLTAPLREAIEALESLRLENPVLRHRLKSLFPGGQFRERATSLEEAEEASFAIGREICARISALKDEFRSEDGRGRPEDKAARKFALALYDVWCEFTEARTSRQNASDRPKDPFGDFVDTAGALVDPDFAGHYVARQVHEARRQGPSGDK